MQDMYVVCYNDLSDNEKKFVNDLYQACSLWREKYEEEIKRLKNEIEWYQKQIDKIGGIK